MLTRKPASDFAANVGIAFKTPEEFFLDAPPEPVTRAFDPALYVSDTPSAPRKSCSSSVYVGSSCAKDPSNAAFRWIIVLLHHTTCMHVFMYMHAGNSILHYELTRVFISI